MQDFNDTPKDDGAPLPDVGAWFGAGFSLLLMFAMYILRYTH